MPDQADEALRARFRALAENEAESAPPFAPTPSRPRAARRRVVVRVRLTVGAVAAVLALAVLGYARWAWRARPVPYPIDLAAVTWTGPTDFLLETPGAALLRELPAIGSGYDTEGGGVPPALDGTSRRDRT